MIIRKSKRLCKGLIGSVHSEPNHIFINRNGVSLFRKSIPIQTVNTACPGLATAYPLPPDLTGTLLELCRIFHLSALFSKRS
jgi:hypothetical protein